MNSTEKKQNTVDDNFWSRLPTFVKVVIGVGIGVALVDFAIGFLHGISK